MKYSKPPLTFEEQADLLLSRGLTAERKELMQLHVHQLEWTPNRIRMAVYETPTEPALVNRKGKGSMGGHNWLPVQWIH